MHGQTLMKEGLLVLLLTALLGAALYLTIRKLRRGGGCCGEHETAAKKTVISDRNPSHYPYTVTLAIGGMTCENCARKVENALNRLDGTWASVSISDHTAKVRCKKQPDETTLRTAVREAGYVVTGCKGIFPEG